MSVSGDEVTFTDHICTEYDLVFAITDHSLTAPLTAMAKKYDFRGATLHGLNDIILNSGLSIDYNLVSRQAELFRVTSTKPMLLKFLLNVSRILRTRKLCGGQTAQKSHGICPAGAPDIANLPAGEVYFVPNSASGSFPFRFSDGTISEMHVSNGAITHADLIKVKIQLSLLGTNNLAKILQLVSLENLGLVPRFFLFLVAIFKTRKSWEHAISQRVGVIIWVAI